MSLIVQIDVTDKMLRAIRGRSLFLMLLVYVGRFRIVTHTQAYRFLTFECRRAGITSTTIVADTIVEAIRCGALCEVRHNIDKAGDQITLHLTDIGYEAVSVQAPAIANEMRFGVPTDFEVRKIRHDLLLAEIPMIVDDCDIVAYHDDLRLKSIAARAREANKCKNINLNLNIGHDDSLPDARICVYQRPIGVDYWLQYEAIVNYSRSKIDDKRDNLYWIADRDYISRKVTVLHSDRVIIRTPLAHTPEPEYDSRVRAALETQVYDRFVRLTLAERVLLEILTKTQMTLSWREFRLFTKLGQQTFNRSINELINANLVHYKFGKISCPDFTTEPLKYICLPENRSSTAGDKFVRHIALNEVFRIVSTQGFKLQTFDPANSVLTVHRKSSRHGTGGKIIFIADIVESYDPTSVTAVCDLYDRYTGIPRTEIKVVVTHPRREKLISDALGDWATFRMTDYEIKALRSSSLQLRN